MTGELSKTSDATPFSWSMVAQSLARPYGVPIPMVLLVALVPFYIFIPELLPPIPDTFPTWRWIAPYL